jgi:hypothetical protein
MLTKRKRKQPPSTNKKPHYVQAWRGRWGKISNLLGLTDIQWSSYGMMPFLFITFWCPWSPVSHLPPRPWDSSTMPSLAGNQQTSPLHSELTRNRTRDQRSEGKGLKPTEPTHPWENRRFCGYIYFKLECASAALSARRLALVGGEVPE